VESKKRTVFDLCSSFEASESNPSSSSLDDDVTCFLLMVVSSFVDTSSSDDESGELSIVIPVPFFLLLLKEMILINKQCFRLERETQRNRKKKRKQAMIYDIRYVWYFRVYRRKKGSVENFEFLIRSPINHHHSFINTFF